MPNHNIWRGNYAKAIFFFTNCPICDFEFPTEVIEDFSLAIHTCPQCSYGLSEPIFKEDNHVLAETAIREARTEYDEICRRIVRRTPDKPSESSKTT